MNLQYRIELLEKLGKYMLSGDSQWQETKEKAGYENGWFTPEFVELSIKNIADAFLQKDKLEHWAAETREIRDTPRTIGVVTAGNIPLVGFHDWLTVFISGHTAAIKLSSKDKQLLPFLVKKMQEWEPGLSTQTIFAEMLKGCDAYIATGSNNSSRYFEYYFGRYPHIIRKNRTSVALLDGTETTGELEQLADDAHLYFGLGCRNVTKLYVPEGYDFVPLLEAFRKYNYFSDHHKYKNNYDYNLALHLLNKTMYMSSGSTLLVENKSLFSPVSQVHYETYTDTQQLLEDIKHSEDVQCLVGRHGLPFGQAQSPSLADYADGVNTLAFLQSV